MKYEHLLGVPFVHGDRDCYDIVRRFYRDNFGIELTDYARPDNWWDADLNLYMDNFRNEGFELVDTPAHLAQPADLFLLALGSRVPNHAGIYLGDGKILHHFFNRNSEVTTLRTIWRTPCAVIRHKDVVIKEPEVVVDLIDRILPHKRAMLLNARNPQ